ncbi:4066_t:CDS:2, partial [Racocetra fulgida]
AILIKLRDFNDSPDKATIQFILTKNLTDAWEEGLEETASEETITLSILTENQNVMEDIYVKCHSSAYDYESGRHNDKDQLTFFVDPLNKLREQIDRFLKKL